MSAMLEPEQDTALALQLMGMRKTATDAEFAAVLSKLLGTCRHEGFRIAIKALQIVLDESKPEFMAKYEHPRAELRIPVVPNKPIIPKIEPMRTREQALEIHRKNHPELYNEDGTRKGYEGQPVGTTLKKIQEDQDLDELERATRPDPPRESAFKFRGPTGKARKVDDDGRADIRKRAAQARLDNLGKHPRGWIKLIAKEYDVSEALIYQIIYSDPTYTAVPRS